MTTPPTVSAVAERQREQASAAERELAAASRHAWQKSDGAATKPRCSAALKAALTKK